MSSALFDHEKQTSDLVSLFSCTLHSLAADAAAVRQATSLAHCIGIVTENHDQQTQAMNQDLLDNLIGLDEIVTGLEEKASALRQIVHEEKAALVKFEGELRREADEQAHFVGQLVEAMQQVVPPRNSTGSESALDAGVSIDSESSDGSSLSAKRRSGGSRRDSVDPRRQSNRSTERERSLSLPAGEENMPPASIVLPRISESELNDYRAKHAVMGPRMLSRANLNEAIEEIEAVCQTQFENSAALKTKQEQKQSHLSSGALQRRYDYLQKRQQKASSNSTARKSLDASHLSADSAEMDPISVTEQQLREKCAFFRHGESTARTTLSVLCGLRRLKQVPTKNREVTYLCLPLLE